VLLSEVKLDSVRKILVTGSRGKSSVVRLLHAALQDAGLQTHARITGVVPRELGPNGVHAISRSARAHVEEMRWWLKGLPASAQAIVLENSAITPDFQALAGRWLRPDVTVLANALPDHQEVWGPTRACAAEVLTRGIPRGGQVIIPDNLQSESYLLDLLDHRGCKLILSVPAPAAGDDFRAINLGLALTTLRWLELATAPALKVMLRLQPDEYEFGVVNCGGAQVAMAFSANDIASTRTLFRSLNWSEQETRLIYNHRMDRPGRLRSFIDWLSNSRWRQVLIIGDRPSMRLGFARFLPIKNVEGLVQQFQPGDQIFGCGNIAGLPLSLATVLDRSTGF